MRVCMPYIYRIWLHSLSTPAMQDVYASDEYLLQTGRGKGDTGGLFDEKRLLRRPWIGTVSFVITP